MNRRKFFKTSALTGTTFTLGLASAGSLLQGCSESGKSAQVNPEEMGMFSFSDKAPDGKPLKAALIGCGGRGTGAAVQFLMAGPNLSVIALADVLPDRLEECRKLLDEKSNNPVPTENCFVGFDAYKKVLEMKEVDVVFICTPTFFHPYMCHEAVQANKHIFLEKPGAVDPAGIQTLIAAGKQAEAAGLTIITGNQRRHSRDYWEAFLQMKKGIIGEIITITTHFNSGSSWSIARKSGWSDMEYNIRNWTNIKWLGGDHILDLGVHNIDVASWFAEDSPITAEGYGGCVHRVMGDTFDFFCGDYTFNNGKRMFSTTRQIAGCEVNVGERIIGSKGIIYLNDQRENRIEDFAGNLLWAYDYEKNPIKSPYEQEHIHLVESIRLNKGINQAQDLANSTLIAIMGREAAYTGKLMKWDELLFSGLRYGPDEKDISKYAMGEVSFYKDMAVPKPGRAV